MHHELHERETLLKRSRGMLLAAAVLALLVILLFQTGLPTGFKAGVAVLMVLVVIVARFFSDFFFENKVLGHTILILASAFALFPVLWILSASFKPQPEILTDLGLWPANPTLQNYADVFSKTPFMTWFGNSLFIALATTACGLFFATTAAFAFSQYRFPGRRAGLYAFLFTQMFPGAILIIPLYTIFSSMQLLDSYPGLIIGYSTISLPYCVWMMKGFFDTIPQSIMEAAKIDGLSTFGIFYKVVMPLSLPGIAVTAFFSFITAWNEFMFANTFMTSSSKMTLPVGLKTFIAEQRTYWEYLTPSAILMTLPLLLFFLIAQKWLISGLTSGGVKG